MQSRSFFTFGPQFSILTDSVFVSQPKLDSSMIPAVATFLMTEDDKYYITEGSDFLITES
jgi:hypothetical protein